ncbi:MAG: carbon storage regulator [Parachlamydiales bacterium]
MLVLTRKRGEKIVIDGRIEITVIKVNGNSISLGIEAPEEINICRGELMDRKERTKPTQDLNDDD